MAVRREQVFREALELGEPDREELLTLLIDSLDPQAEADVEQAWMQEISRRVTELKTGAVQTLPWEVVRKRLRSAASG